MNQLHDALWRAPDHSRLWTADDRMSYLLGRTELLRVQHTKVGEQGWSLKRFNAWILSCGTLP